MENMACTPEEALQILVKAEGIKKDSVLMAGVQALAKKQAPAIKSIADLKAKYDELVKADNEVESDPEGSSADTSEDVAEGEDPNNETDHNGAKIEQEPKMKVDKPKTYSTKVYKAMEK